MAIKPLADRVVAKKDAAVEQTASGILLGEAKEKQNTAVVESVGPDVKNVKKGDRILYREYSATEVKLDSKEYLIIKEEDILSGIELIDLPKIELSEEDEWKAKNGQKLIFETKEDKVLLIKSNSLIAVYKRKNENTFVPERGLF